MYSSHTNRTSIENIRFHATIRLSVPAATSTTSIRTKIRSYSFNKVSSSTRKIRCRLSALVISFSKCSTSNKQTITHTTDNPSDNNNKQIMPTTITLTPRYYQSSTSSSKYNKSINIQLLGIWHRFNNNESRCSTSSPIDQKSLAFSEIVSSLLSFPSSKKTERDEWIQLVGHPGTFKKGIHHGFILKELNEQERYCCELLQNDILRDFVPKYNGIVIDEEGKSFIEIEDLLTSFHEPCIMDCKIGVRTYLEEELEKSERDPEPRSDLYNKMIAIDPLAPTDKENEEKKILKPRYMIWRESLSSTQDLGFRIEAIKESRSLMSKEFQRIKERNDIKKQLDTFIENSLPRATRYLERLIELRSACVRSNFFQNHELIGSSLLFVHDGNKASIWMIDFGKTRLLPDGINITHEKAWIRGSHEDGYLFGLDNLISLFREIIDEIKST